MNFISYKFKGKSIRDLIAEKFENIGIEIKNKYPKKPYLNGEAMEQEIIVSGDMQECQRCFNYLR